MKRGGLIWKSSEGNSVLGCCSGSKKLFKAIRFSPDSRRWEPTRNKINSSSFPQQHRDEEELVTRCSSSILDSTNDAQQDEEICFPYLPDELVTQIFEWLPIKSIVRFRLVSKSWRALFKTPTFIENHRLKQQVSGTSTMLLLRRRYAPPASCHEVLSFHDLDSPELEVRDPIPILWPLRRLIGRVTLQFYIIGAVNGIICILTSDRFVLCNPALREFKLLPPIPWADPPPGYSRVPCASGFGVSSSGDFKVIIFYRFMSPDDHTYPSIIAHLYNSRTDSWRAPFDPPPVCPGSIYSYGADSVLLHGRCHWIGKTFSSSYKMIVSFDFTSEVFRQLELPDSLVGDTEGFTRIILINNCLGAVHTRQRFSFTEPCEVWVMNEYGVKGSWNKLLVTSPQPYATTFLPWKNDTIFMFQTPGLIYRRRTVSVQNRSLTDFDSKFNDWLSSISLLTGEKKEFQVLGAELTFCGLIYEESLVTLN